MLYTAYRHVLPVEIRRGKIWTTCDTAAGSTAHMRARRCFFPSTDLGPFFSLAPYIYYSGEDLTGKEKLLCARISYSVHSCIHVGIYREALCPIFFSLPAAIARVIGFSERYIGFLALYDLLFNGSTKRIYIYY